MNTTLAPSLFLEKLRNATAQSHTNLESLPVSVSIMKPDVTAEEYILYLSMMYDVVCDAESNIFPALSSVISDLGERTKSGFIINDLITLGVERKENLLPLSNSLPNGSIAFKLGIMYVVEGSSLGGRVILKNISNTLGYDAAKGARYFAGYGGETGSHWKTFLNMLMAYESKYDCADDIIAGANYAFRAISLHFTHNAPIKI